MNETKWQKRICEHVKRENPKHFAVKWATDVHVGAPDLLVCCGNAGLMGIEMKHLPRWNKNTARLLGFTTIQALFIERMLRAGAPAYGLVITEFDGDYHMAPVFFSPHQASLRATAMPRKRSGLPWHNMTVVQDHFAIALNEWANEALSRYRSAARGGKDV